MGQSADDEIDDFGKLFQSEATGPVPPAKPPHEANPEPKNPVARDARIDDATLVAGATPATFSTRKPPKPADSSSHPRHRNLGETMDSSVLRSGQSTGGPAPVAPAKPPDSVGELGNQLIEFNFISVQDWYDALHGADDPQSVESVLTKLIDTPCPSRDGEMVLTVYQAERIATFGVADLVYDHYRIVDRLGAGGMGDVLKARHVDNPNIVAAIKTISPRLLSNWDMLERFKREVNFLARLDPRYFPQIHHVGKRNELPFFAMTYVRGQTLGDKIKKQAGKPLPIEEVVRMFAEIAEAIQKAHDQSLVHRDIKSANIMVTSDGNPMILDFGIAGAVESAQAKETEDQQTRLTMVGGGVGTPEFMPPEQFFGDEPPTYASDVYSLGVTLFHAVTGSIPFSASTVREIQQKHISDKRPRPSLYRPGLPKKLERVILKCLAVEPKARYQSMTELAQALRKSVVPFQWKAIAATVLAVGMTAGVVWAFVPTPPPPPPIHDRVALINEDFNKILNKLKVIEYPSPPDQSVFYEVLTDCGDFRETHKTLGTYLVPCEAVELIASAGLTESADMPAKYIPESKLPAYTAGLLAKTKDNEADQEFVARIAEAPCTLNLLDKLLKLESSLPDPDGRSSHELARDLFSSITNPKTSLQFRDRYWRSLDLVSQALISNQTPDNFSKAEKNYEIIFPPKDDTPPTADPLLDPIRLNYANLLSQWALILLEEEIDATNKEAIYACLTNAKAKYDGMTKLLDCPRDLADPLQRTLYDLAGKAANCSAAIELLQASPNLAVTDRPYTVTDRPYKAQDYLDLYRRLLSPANGNDGELAAPDPSRIKVLDEALPANVLERFDNNTLPSQHAEIAFQAIMQENHKLILETKAKLDLASLLKQINSAIQVEDDYSRLNLQTEPEISTDLHLWRAAIELAQWLSAADPKPDLYIRDDLDVAAKAAGLDGEEIEAIKFLLATCTNQAAPNEPVNALVVDPIEIELTKETIEPAATLLGAFGARDTFLTQLVARIKHTWPCSPDGKRKKAFDELAEVPPRLIQCRVYSLADAHELKEAITEKQLTTLRDECKQSVDGSAHIEIITAIANDLFNQWTSPADPPTDDDSPSEAKIQREAERLRLLLLWRDFNDTSSSEVLSNRLADSYYLLAHLCFTNGEVPGIVTERLEEDSGPTIVQGFDAKSDLILTMLARAQSGPDARRKGYAEAYEAFLRCLYNPDDGDILDKLSGLKTYTPPELTHSHVWSLMLAVADLTKSMPEDPPFADRGPPKEGGRRWAIAEVRNQLKAFHLMSKAGADATDPVDRALSKSENARLLLSKLECHAIRQILAGSRNSVHKTIELMAEWKIKQPKVDNREQPKVINCPWSPEMVKIQLCKCLAELDRLAEDERRLRDLIRKGVLDDESVAQSNIWRQDVLFWRVSFDFLVREGAKYRNAEARNLKDGRITDPDTSNEEPRVKNSGKRLDGLLDDIDEYIRDGDFKDLENDYVRDLLGLISTSIRNEYRKDLSNDDMDRYYQYWDRFFSILTKLPDNFDSDRVLNDCRQYVVYNRAFSKKPITTDDLDKLYSSKPAAWRKTVIVEADVVLFFTKYWYVTNENKEECVTTAQRLLPLVEELTSAKYAELWLLQARLVLEDLVGKDVRVRFSTVGRITQAASMPLIRYLPNVDPIMTLPSWSDLFGQVGSPYWKALEKYHAEVEAEKAKEKLNSTTQ